jgi:hypothetical protein
MENNTFTLEDTKRVAAEIVLMRIDNPKASLMEHPEIRDLWGQNRFDIIQEISDETKGLMQRIKAKIITGEIE